MKFYLEPEFRDNQLHPSGYRLWASGPGRFQGEYGVITDADIAHLIVELLNAAGGRDVPKDEP